MRWDSRSGRRLGVLSGHAGGVFSLRYTADGNTLAVGGGGGTVRLWDMATGGLITTLAGHTDTVLALAFREDGKLIGVSEEGVVREWDVSYLRDPYRALCERAGRAMTRAEWDQYVGDLPFQKVCAQ